MDNSIILQRKIDETKSDIRRLSAIRVSKGNLSVDQQSELKKLNSQLLKLQEQKKNNEKRIASVPLPPRLPKSVASKSTSNRNKSFDISKNKVNTLNTNKHKHTRKKKGISQPVIKLGSKSKDQLYEDQTKSLKKMEKGLLQNDNRVVPKYSLVNLESEIKVDDYTAPYNKRILSTKKKGGKKKGTQCNRKKRKTRSHRKKRKSTQLKRKRSTRKLRSAKRSK